MKRCAIFFTLFLAAFSNIRSAYAERNLDGRLDVSLAQSMEPLQIKYLPHISVYETEFIFVLLSNISEQPIHVWSLYYSKGYGMLRFRIHGSKGVRVVERKPIGWDSNVPIPRKINPGEVFVIPIDLNDGSWSERLPGLRIGRVQGARSVGKIEAILEIDQGVDQRRCDVASGEVSSKKQVISQTDEN